jgi:stage V sporulation protein B
VSRYTTERPERAAALRGAGFRMHLYVGVPIALGFAAISPLIAFLAHDMSKMGPLMLAAGIILVYSFYCVLVGSANGTRQFHKQAGLDIGASTLRAAAIIGAAVAGLGLWGMIGGWVAASSMIFLVAAVWVGLPRGVERDRVKPMFWFLVGLAGYGLLMQLINTSDQLLLKRFTADWFRGHPDWLQANSEWLRDHAASLDPAKLLAGAAAWESDGQIGFYRAVQNLSRLPYQLMMAVTFVVFPLVSRATFEGDLEKTRSYVRTTLRYSLIFAAALGAVIAANPTTTMNLLFKPDYALNGAPAVIALSIGNVAFAIFTIAGAILNAAGRTRDAVIIAAGTWIVLIAALWIFVPGTEPGRPVLLRCATVSGAAMLLGAVASGVMLWRSFGAFLPALTIVRVILAGAVAGGVGHFLRLESKLMTVAEAVAVGVAFLATLVVTGELGRKDLAVLRRKK